MQVYSRVFSYVYNKWWNEFSNLVAPRILEYYENTPISQVNKSILDLCCGTGQLAVYLLERGYSVLGIDLSEDMLHHARKNAGSHLETGQAKFIRGDAASFALNQQFGLVVSVFDSLNHLDSFGVLRSSFECIFSVLEEDGLFIFDLNTSKGLTRWNEIFVQDTNEAMIVTRGFYGGLGGKAWMKISGFVRTDEGFYERFEETLYNTVFEMEMVKKALFEVGWNDVYFAKSPDLDTPIEEPEKERRVFFVAKK